LVLFYFNVVIDMCSPNDFPP